MLDALEVLVRDDDRLDMVNRYTRRRLLILGFPAEPEHFVELVQNAISDTWTGVRNFDPTVVSASTHITGVIRDRTWKAFKRLEKVRPQQLPGEDGKGQPLPSGVDEVRRVEMFELARKSLDALTKMAEEKDDQEVLSLLVAYEMGVSGRTNLSIETGMTVDEVTNATKKLQRLVNKLPEELRLFGRAEL